VTQLTQADAHHLMRRAGFGVTAAQAQALVGQEREALVEQLITQAPQDHRPIPYFAGISEDFERFQAMRHWTYDQLGSGSSPLVEKLALFWHGHFCSEEPKCGWFRMWNQWQIFRQLGRGDFRQLTKAVSVDPAMLTYLDNRDNVRGNVQENFARELWELFMLGPDQYTQDEIVDSARAWTGHGVNNRYDELNERYVFDANKHDTGTKNIFGAVGNHDGPDVIDITLDRKGDIVSRFIAAKLWSFFAWPIAADAGGPVNDVAGALRGSWRISDALRTLFNHPQFWSTQARQGLVKTPIELLVTTMKVFGFPAKDFHPEWYEQVLGQQLFSPPNVSGWRPNAYWLSATTFYARAELAQSATWFASERLRSSSGRNEAQVFDDVEAMAPADAVTTVLTRLGVVAPSPATLAACTDLVTTIRNSDRWAESLFLTRLAMIAPEFHLV
jgi:uncharacterized protein (DUF1800 family)